MFRDGDFTIGRTFVLRQEAIVWVNASCRLSRRATRREDMITITDEEGEGWLMLYQTSTDDSGLLGSADESHRAFQRSGEPGYGASTSTGRPTPAWLLRYEEGGFETEASARGTNQRCRQSAQWSWW